MDIAWQAYAQTEEQLVTELAQLGVSYLSRQGGDSFSPVGEPHELMAGLVCQRSSRVRSALIALLLARPDYTIHISRAMKLLDPKQTQVLRLFYTAAVYLQQEHAEILQAFLGPQCHKLPDLFSVELGITGDSPGARLQNLARLHAQSSGEILNWAGTYENAARHLLRRWEKEQSWKA